MEHSLSLILSKIIIIKNFSQKNPKYYIASRSKLGISNNRKTDRILQARQSVIVKVMAAINEHGILITNYDKRIKGSEILILLTLATFD